MIRRKHLDVQSCSIIEDHRKILLSFLVELFYEPPTLERMEEWKKVKEEEWIRELRTKYQRFDQLVSIFGILGVNEVQIQIQEQYHSIFNVFNEKAKIQAYLWESYYIKQHPNELTSSTYQMRHKLHEFDLRYKLDSFLPEDHISVQLDFLLYLLDYTDDAEKNRNYSNFEKGVYTELWLLKDHLLRWIPEFCEDIRKAQEDSIYVLITELLIELLEEDYRNVRLMKDSIES